jgi:hypothetical protein
MRKFAYLLTGLLCSVSLAAGFALTATAASAAPLTLSGTTYLPDNGDSGNSLSGNFWADDSFQRVLSVTATPDACAVPVNGLTCYTATASDTGTFRTIVGNGQAPNPASTTDAGTNIAFPSVSGPFTGSATYIFQTSATPAAADIPNVVNNHGGHPSTGDDSTADWFVNAFSVSAAFDNSAGQPVTIGAANDDVLQNTWGWTYTSMTGAGPHTNAVACETWADSFSNGAGDTAADGNITGTQCAGTLKPHYTRVPNCIGRRVYVCTQLLSGRGLRWSLDTVRRAHTAYFVRSTKPAVGSVVLKGSTVNVQDVLKSGL